MHTDGATRVRFNGHAWASLDLAPARYAHPHWMQGIPACSQRLGAAAHARALRSALGLTPLAPADTAQPGTRALLLEPTAFAAWLQALCVVAGMPVSAATAGFPPGLPQALAAHPLPWRPLAIAVADSAAPASAAMTAVHAAAWVSQVEARVLACAQVWGPTLTKRLRIRLGREASAGPHRPLVDRPACAMWWAHVDGVLNRFDSELKVLS